MKLYICKTCGKDVTGDGDYDGVDINGNCFSCMAGEHTGCIVLKRIAPKKVKLYKDEEILCNFRNSYFVSIVYYLPRMSWVFDPKEDKQTPITKREYAVDTGKNHILCKDLDGMWLLPPT